MYWLLLIIVGFFGSVAAFTMQLSSVRPSTALAATRSKSIPFLLQPLKLDGSLAGDEGFDPLGLSDLDDALGLDLYWMREAELKHCRVAMLASVGFIGQEMGVVFPGMPMVQNQVDAFWQLFNTNPGPIYASMILFGILEIISGIAVTEGRKSGQRMPGDFSFNPLNMGKSSASAKDLALKEVRNGRLAMIAAVGMLVQACTTSTGALGNLF